MVRRTEKTLQHLAASAHERLPLMYESSHPLTTLSKHRVLITFHRRPTYVLVSLYYHSILSIHLGVVQIIII